MKSKLTLISLVFMMFSGIILFAPNLIYAENLEVGLLPYKIKSSDDGSKILIVVKNNGDSVSTIKLINIGPTIKFQLPPTTGQIISSNSSIPIYAIINTKDLSPGTYSTVIQVIDEDNNSGTAVADITVESQIGVVKNLELSLDNVALLLAAFVIPSQFIERILEMGKSRHKGATKHKEELYIQDEKIVSLEKTREKLVETVAKELTQNDVDNLVGVLHKPFLKGRLTALQEIQNNDPVRTDILESDITDLLKAPLDVEKIRAYLTKTLPVDEVEPEILLFRNNIIAIETRFNDFLQNNAPSLTVEQIRMMLTVGPIDPNLKYVKYLQTLDLQISTARETKAKHQADHEIHMWYAALGIATIPAMGFAFAGLGIFNMLELSITTAIPADILVNTLFIGSGTKPLHDIIEWLKKAKTK